MNTEQFLLTLPMTLYGMGGIFLVILLVYLSIAIMNRAFKGKKEEK